LNTLNNTSLWDASTSTKISDDEYKRERCWKAKKGLRVWDVTSQGVPKSNENGIFEDVDVVLITASSLQTDPTQCWVTQIKWTTVLADEAHDYLRGQHNARPGSQSLTLKNWHALQHLTKSIFLITGTPFVTKISYDVVAITKAVAREEIRRCWGKEYSDAGLEEMVRGWKSDLSNIDPDIRRQQEELRTNVKDKLALFMIRRDENSTIRGQHVMRDYFRECTVSEDTLVATDGGKEVREREEVYRHAFTNSDSMTKTRNDNMRCLCWSYRFIQWKDLSDRGRAAFWDDFSLSEVERHIRTRALVQILKQGKTSGNGVIIFVQRTFQAELCLKASPLSPFRLLIEDLRSIEVEIRIHRCESGKTLQGQV
jgi:hypothetical protein